MLHEGDRAAIGDAGYCPIGFRTWSAGRANASPVVFDEAVLFLDRRLSRASAAMMHAEPTERMALLRRIVAYAQAMAVIPSRGRQAIDAKVHAARWSFDLGAHSVQLDATLCSELMASAFRDRHCTDRN